MGKRHEHAIDGIKEPRLPLSQEALGQQMSPNGGTSQEKNGHHGNKGFLLPVEGMWREFLGRRVVQGGCCGQTAGQLDGRADGPGKT